MDEKDRHIANRVILGAAIGSISLIALLLLGAALASYAPEHQFFVSFKLIVGLVFMAVFIGDRLYASRHKPDRQ